MKLKRKPNARTSSHIAIRQYISITGTRHNAKARAPVGYNATRQCAFV